MKSSDNNSKSGGKPETNDVEFEEDSGQLTGSKNAAGGGSKSSEGGKQPLTDTRTSTLTNIQRSTVGDSDDFDDNTISSPQNLDNASTDPIHSPGGASFTVSPKLNNELKIKRADLEATIALRRYLTACKAVQNDMLTKGDPKNAFMKYHEAVKDIPGAPSLPSCLRQIKEADCKADNDRLRDPGNYEGIINSRIKDLENEPNHKPTTEEYTWHNRESANAIAVLQSQGFYDREPYLPSGRLGLKGRMPVFAGRNEVKADDDAWKKVRESKSAWLYGGVHYKVDPETRSVKARYRKNMFSRGTRSQAKSFFQGMVAAGRLGDIPMNVVLNSKNPAIVRDQIKNLAEEAARRGIPLETIKIETPGLKGLKPQTLQQIVLDASRGQSQYDKKWNWGQMISPIRQSHLGKNLGESIGYHNTWADKLIKQDQEERTDGTMGKKTVHTSEADVKAISNGSLYLDGDGHRAMRIPEGSAEQPRVEQNRTNSIASHDKNVKDCEAALKTAEADLASKEDDYTEAFNQDSSDDAKEGEKQYYETQRLAQVCNDAKKAVESCEKKLDKAKQDRADFANIARKDQTKSQADKTTMGQAMEAYMNCEGKFYKNGALGFFNAVNNNHGKEFGGNVDSAFGTEVINDAKVGLKKKLRKAADTCRKAKNARDETKDNRDNILKNMERKKSKIATLEGDIGTLKSKIDTDPQDDKSKKSIEEKTQKLDKKQKELTKKGTELVTIKKVLDDQNKVLDKSRLEFADAYNRYHQAEHLSETSPSKDWEGIVKAPLPSVGSPLQNDSEHLEYRRGMLNPEDTVTIENTMQELTDYNFLNRNFFENTYVATQKHAQEANDQYIRQANDTPDVKIDDTPVNANRETQGLGIVDTDEAIDETEAKLRQLESDFEHVNEEIDLLQSELDTQAAGGEDKSEVRQNPEELRMKKNKIQKSLTGALQEHITQLDAKVNSLLVENKEGNNPQIAELRDLQKEDNERLADLRGNQGPDDSGVMVPPTPNQQALTNALEMTDMHIDNAQGAVTKAIKTLNNTPAVDQDNANDGTPKNQ